MVLLHERYPGETGEITGSIRSVVLAWPIRWSAIEVVDDWRGKAGGPAKKGYRVPEDDGIESRG
jgi:hypothetical protein